jgi:hypothetical protein
MRAARGRARRETMSVREKAKKPQTRGLAKFKQPDVIRAIRCAERAGLKIIGIEVLPAGGFRVLTADKSSNTEPLSELDQWKARRHAR